MRLPGSSGATKTALGSYKMAQQTKEYNYSYNSMGFGAFPRACLATTRKYGALADLPSAAPLTMKKSTDNKNTI